MTPATPLMLALWTEARTRFSNQLEALSEADLLKKLSPSPNSIGFLIRHIGDVEMLFAKNVFGDSLLHVSAKTVIAQKDTGEWTNLAALMEYQLLAFQSLRNIVAAQSDDDWQSVISTKEFGTKTKAEAFGRIISHTTYHAGQISVIKKYGTN
jgi:uncharacterized damage-inducible protein DinB